MSNPYCGHTPEPATHVGPHGRDCFGWACRDCAVWLEPYADVDGDDAYPVVDVCGACGAIPAPAASISDRAEAGGPLLRLYGWTALAGLLLVTPALAGGGVDPVWTVPAGGRCQQYARGPEVRSLLWMAYLPVRRDWAAVVCTGGDGAVTGRFVDGRGRPVCEIRGRVDPATGRHDEVHIACANGRTADIVWGRAVR